MKTLADMVLDYCWFLNFSGHEEVDPDRAVQLLEELSYQMENELSEPEKAQLRLAASKSLKAWLKEPDEHGYTPRKLLTPDQKEFLESIAAGHFSGSPDDDREA
jgi:hypothetical protein